MIASASVEFIHILFTELSEKDIYITFLFIKRLFVTPQNI